MVPTYQRPEIARSVSVAPARARAARNLRAAVRVRAGTRAAVMLGSLVPLNRAAGCGYCGVPFEKSLLNWFSTVSATPWSVRMIPSSRLLPTELAEKFIEPTSTCWVDRP